MSKAADYNTINKKKRFLEAECRRLADAADHVNGEAITYLDEPYGIRRQKAILHYLDRAEAEFKDFGLNSVIETFAYEEFMPFSNYNHLDSDFDIRTGAALYILDRLRAGGTMGDAFELLPDLGGNMDTWYLPADFYHPCYSNSLIQSVIHLLTHRYDRGRGSKKYQSGIILTGETASGEKPGEAYLELIKLLPQDDVEKACAEFKEKVWDLAARRMKVQGYFDREIRKCAEDVRILTMKGPLADPSAGSFKSHKKLSPLLKLIAGETEESDDADNSVVAAARKGKELGDKERQFTLHFDQLLISDRKTVIRKTGIREIADALKGFTVKDPYELCFALFCLIDSGDDAPWLIRSGCSLILYCLRMVPWHMEQDDWDDDEWDEWYDGVSYNVNGWTEREPVPDQFDLLHEKHNGRNLAQVIYELCRCFVPINMHPFDKDRERLVAEGMDEEKARKITEIADLLFLSNFQVQQDVEPDLPEEDSGAALTGDSEARHAAGQAQKQDSEERRGRGKARENDTTDSSVGFGSRKERVIGSSEGQGDFEISDNEDCLAENEKLKEELAAARKQLKSLRSVLAVSRQEFNNERAKYEHELKTLRMEHRELADLRELVFNRESEGSERLEKTEKNYSYPYDTVKRTVVFGGHDSFLRAFKPMFRNVRFVDASNLAYNPDIIRNADVVWIQNNCISHSQFWSVVKNCKLAGVQMRYFGFASAEKCAEQLVTEDQKA